MVDNFIIHCWFSVAFPSANIYYIVFSVNLAQADSFSLLFSVAVWLFLLLFLFEIIVLFFLKAFLLPSLLHPHEDCNSSPSVRHGIRDLLSSLCLHNLSSNLYNLVVLCKITFPNFRLASPCRGHSWCHIEPSLAQHARCS